MTQTFDLGKINLEDRSIKEWWTNATDIVKANTIKAGVYVIREGLTEGLCTDKNDEQLYKRMKKVAEKEVVFDENLKIAKLEQILAQKEAECDRYYKMVCVQEERDKALEQLSIFKSTNKGLGVTGELKIADSLIKLFPTYEVVVKGGVEMHCQDIHMYLEDENTMIAFESKNKKVITRGDVQKFYSDLDDLAHQGKCEGAMFVSLNSKNIPGKGFFSLEHYKNKPVLFTSFENETDFNNFFPKYVNMFVGLCKSFKDNQNNQTDTKEEISIFIEKLTPNIKLLKKMKKDCKAISDSIQTMSKSFTSVQRTIDTIISNMELTLT